MNPPMDAVHRAALGRSPSSGPDNNTTKIGARKVIAEASASGRKRNAPKNAAVAQSSSAERSSCNAGRRVRQKPSPARCHAKGVTTNIWPA